MKIVSAFKPFGTSAPFHLKITFWVAIVKIKVKRIALFSKTTTSLCIFVQMNNEQQKIEQ